MDTRRAMETLRQETLESINQICQDPETTIIDLCEGLKASTDFVKTACANELYKRTGRPRSRSECCTDHSHWIQWIARNDTIHISNVDTNDDTEINRNRLVSRLRIR